MEYKIKIILMKLSYRNSVEYGVSRLCFIENALIPFFALIAMFFFLTGNVCAMFSKVRMGIVRVDGSDCKECPYRYNSTKSSVCKI